MDLSGRLESLRKNLERYKPDHLCPSGVIGTYNALLAEAKAQLPEDPVVTVLETVEFEAGYGLSPGGEQYVDCGTVVIWIDQIQGAHSEAHG